MGNPGFDGFGAHWWVKDRPADPPKKKPAPAPQTQPEITDQTPWWVKSPEGFHPGPPVDEIVAPGGQPVRTGITTANGRPVGNTRGLIADQPTKAQVAGMSAGMMSGLASGAENLASGADTSRIRSIMAARQAANGVASQMDPPDYGEPAAREPEPMASGDRYAAFRRNDYLRRMAMRHENQLSQAGMSYEDLEREYDSAPGSHQDKVGDMGLGLINRLRVARDMDIAKRVRERAQQDNMARRLGVHRAGVIFHDDMANAQTPEDRIRVALAYHAMYPNLGLGNMAAAMAQQQAEGEGIEATSRLQSQQAADSRAHEAEQARLAREHAANTQNAMNQLTLMQLGFQGQNAMNQQALVNSGALAQTNASNMARMLEIMANEDSQRRMIETQANAAEKSAPFNSMVQAPQKAMEAADANPADIIPILNAHSAIMAQTAPDSSPNANERRFSSIGTPVALRLVQNGKYQTPEGRQFLTVWTSNFIKGSGGSQTNRATQDAWARALGFDSITDPSAAYLYQQYTGINPLPLWNYRPGFGAFDSE